MAYTSQVAKYNINLRPRTYHRQFHRPWSIMIFIVTERKVEEDMNFEIDTETEYGQDTIVNINGLKKGFFSQRQRRVIWSLTWTRVRQVSIEIPDDRLDSVSLKRAARKIHAAKEEQLRWEAEARTAAIMKQARGEAAER